MQRMRTRLSRAWPLLGVAVLACLATALSGCGAAQLNRPVSMEARCRVGQTQTGVLVTEWSAADKANLEAALQRGAVAVAFSGCALHIIPQCQLGGVYRWHRTTPASESLELRSEADLFTKLPLGAVTLSGELKRSGSLTVTTTVAGQARLDGPDGSQVPTADACAAVTHVVTAVSVGAFTMTAGGKRSGKVSASVRGYGEAGGGGSRSAKLVRSAGDARSCSDATEQAPSADCASPVQLFLSPVPGRTPTPGPPGTVNVDVVSAAADARWDVIVDDQARCTTPCSLHADPSRPLVLRTRESRPDQLRIPGFRSEVGPVQVLARPTRNGQFVTGMTFTALGGMALVTGIALTGAGCSQDDEPGLCTAGQITMGAATPVLLGAIWLMLDARADYRVVPLFGGGAGGLGVAGRF